MSVLHRPSLSPSPPSLSVASSLSLTMSRPAASSHVQLHKAMFERLTAVAQKEQVETQRNWKTFRAKKSALAPSGGTTAGPKGKKHAWYAKSEPHVRAPFLLLPPADLAPSSPCPPPPPPPPPLLANPF